MATSAAPSNPAGPKPPPIWEDFVDIFVAPAQVFLRRQGKGFIVPLIVLTLVFAALAIGTKPLMQPVYDAMLAKQAEVIQARNPQITEDQLASMRSMGDKFAVVGAVVSMPFIILITGLVFWGIGKLFESQQTLGDAMMVSSYSYFPKILAMVAAALLAFITDPSRLTSPYIATLGPGYLLGPDASPVLLAIVGRLDVFTIWVTVLLGIGLHLTGKISKQNAFIVAAIVWVLGALPGVYGALRMR